MGFVGGMQYQKIQRANFGNGQFFTNRGGQMMGRTGNSFQGQRPVYGQIISQDDKSITVKAQDGSTKIIILSEKTTINKASEGTKQDLKDGEQVLVFGAENSDGSVTATNIQLGTRLRVGQGIPTPQPQQ